MLSAKDIVLKARLSLGDMEADRWSDDRLLDLVDEAQKDVCLNTHLYRKDAYIPLIVGQCIYDLPDDTLIVHRVQTLNQLLPFTTKDMMDSKSLQWRDERAELIELVMKDSIPMNKIEVYPVPDGSMFYIPTYKGIDLGVGTQVALLDVEGVWSDMVYDGTRSNMPETLGVYTGTRLIGSLDIQGIEPDLTVWGVLVDYYEIDASGTVSIDYDFIDYPNRPLGVTSEATLARGSSGDTSLFGVMVDLDPDHGYLGSGWGAVASIIEEGAVMKVLYSASPPTIGSLSGPLVLASIWETALKYYVAGYALMDDNDAGNMARGAEFLKRYQRELNRAQTLSTIEQHDAVGSNVTKYNTAFRE